MKKNIINNYVLFLLLTIYGCMDLISTVRPVDLGNGYKVETNKNYIYIIDSERNILADGHRILEFMYDSVFIIASQRPWDSIPGIRNMTYYEANKAFKHSSFKQYWIINKKEEHIYSFDTLHKIARYSNVYGPFHKIEYLQKRKELGVSDTLQLSE